MNLRRCLPLPAAVLMLVLAGGTPIIEAKINVPAAVFRALTTSPITGSPLLQSATTPATWMVAIALGFWWKKKAFRQTGAMRSEQQQSKTMTELMRLLLIYSVMLLYGIDVLELLFGFLFGKDVGGVIVGVILSTGCGIWSANVAMNRGRSGLLGFCLGAWFILLGVYSAHQLGSTDLKTTADVPPRQNVAREVLSGMGALFLLLLALSHAPSLLTGNLVMEALSYPRSWTFGPTMFGAMFVATVGAATPAYALVAAVSLAAFAGAYILSKRRDA